jgi:hypothetical protein
MIPLIGLAISTIGIMVGMYIITRMACLEDTSTVGQILQGLTIMVAVVGIISLVCTGIQLVFAGYSLALKMGQDFP